MSEDLLRKLELLEDEYPGQPVVAQQVDLQEINRIRTHLGLPLVDSRLNVAGTVGRPAVEEARPEPRDPQDHAEARRIYRAYRKMMDELKVHRAYAEEVATATAGRGQTPVRPLATMGTDGGPLLCDHCRKPIVLEGGPFHGVAADVAWRTNPSEGWTSWILGGMVVEIQTNGTLRIYHGYPHGLKDCCCVASRAEQEARARFESRRDPQKRPMILAFLEQEFPDMTREERFRLVGDILDGLYSYDPGLGINRPGGQAGKKRKPRASSPGRGRGRKRKSR